MPFFDSNSKLLKKQEKSIPLPVNLHHEILPPL